MCGTIDLQLPMRCADASRINRDTIA